MADDLSSVLSARRADEERFAPVGKTSDDTRIIPMAQIQDQLQNRGVVKIKFSQKKHPEEPSVTDTIIEYGKKGYAIKNIAKIVDPDTIVCSARF